MATEHARPWWYSLALVLVPHRCREIPEAQDPSRIVLRQVALWYRHLYLQQFSGSEDPRWMHSHQWRWTLALGLWGSYIERRLGERGVIRQAPYFYVMDHRVVHHVQYPSAGHTSLFLGLFRDDDLKFYYPTGNYRTLPEGTPVGEAWVFEVLDSPKQRVPWHQHIRKMVARI